MTVEQQEQELYGAYRIFNGVIQPHYSVMKLDATIVKWYDFKTLTITHKPKDTELTIAHIRYVENSEMWHCSQMLSKLSSRIGEETDRSGTMEGILRKLLVRIADTHIKEYIYPNVLINWCAVKEGY